MATYNGEKYLQEQIVSILPQLGTNSELVIVDDGSTDNTLEIIDSFRDSRIKIFRNYKNRGVVCAFDRGLREATGDIIFLCDQDDIWAPDKVQTVVDAFSRDPSLTLVFSNTHVIDERGNHCGKSFRGVSRSWGGVLVTFIANRYVGCTMAFRKAICEAALPIPTDVPMHDSWIALVNAFIGKAEFIESELVLYRRHSSNATARGRLGFTKKLRHRWVLLKYLVLRAPRIFEAQEALSNSRTATT